MSSAHRHPIFSRVYPRIAHTAERGGGAEHRRTLLDGLSGRVIEVGAGHGLNFPYYGEGVTQVLAVEPEPYLRGVAEHAAPTATVPIDVRDGIAEALPAEDAEFDVAVASLVLCSVDDQQAALGEILRRRNPFVDMREQLQRQSTFDCHADLVRIHRVEDFPEVRLRTSRLGHTV